MKLELQKRILLNFTDKMNQLFRWNEYQSQYNILTCDGNKLFTFGQDYI